MAKSFRKKRVAVLVYIDVPVGTPYSAATMARDVKHYLDDYIRDEAFSVLYRDTMLTYDAASRAIGKLHAKATTMRIPSKADRRYRRPPLPL
jgi:hypothetical protein